MELRACAGIFMRTAAAILKLNSRTRPNRCTFPGQGMSATTRTSRG